MFLGFCSVIIKQVVCILVCSCEVWFGLSLFCFTEHYESREASQTSSSGPDRRKGTVFSLLRISNLETNLFRLVLPWVSSYELCCCLAPATFFLLTSAFLLWGRTFTPRPLHLRPLRFWAHFSTHIRWQYLLFLVYTNKLLLSFISLITGNLFISKLCK